MSDYKGIKTFEELIEKEHGELGTDSRNKYEQNAQMFILSEMLKAARKEAKLTQEQFSGDIAAGAYYFHYSAADWGKKVSYTPMLGTYDATEAGVMGQHRQWADAVRVDFFIFKWIKD